MPELELLELELLDFIVGLLQREHLIAALLALKLLHLQLLDLWLLTVHLLELELSTVELLALELVQACYRMAAGAAGTDRQLLALELL